MDGQPAGKSMAGESALLVPTQFDIDINLNEFPSGRTDLGYECLEFRTGPTRGLDRDFACSILRLGVLIAREATVSKIVPNLWYTEKAEEAATFYASVLPNSKVDSVTALPADSPSGTAGSVTVVEFTLIGQPFMAFSAGPLDTFNHSISFMVQCDEQIEIDRLWAALSEGGKIEQCGWLKDRYGLYWQIVPTVLGAMMKDSDRARAKRVAEAMLKMIKLDIDGLKKAYEGR
jgi:predicted 3-demethylubiquinone-9 3-methyltransferase (glyoxalase superfamily)